MAVEAPSLRLQWREWWEGGSALEMDGFLDLSLVLVYCSS